MLSSNSRVTEASRYIPTSTSHRSTALKLSAFLNWRAKYELRISTVRALYRNLHHLPCHLSSSIQRGPYFPEEKNAEVGSLSMCQMF